MEIGSTLLVQLSLIWMDAVGTMNPSSATHRIALLMCAEKDPLLCHRMILICRHLRMDDICINHIHENGSVENNQDAEIRLMKQLKIDPKDLFSTEADQIQRAYDLQGDKVAHTIKEELED